jgi:hypothetical protein
MIVISEGQGRFAPVYLPLLLCGALGTLLAMPHSLACQTIRGVVLSAEDLSPIELARVHLIDLDRGGSETRFTDELGRFFVEDAPGQANRIEVSAMGYLSHVDSVFAWVPDEPLVLEIRLGVDAIPLDPLVVVGSMRPLWESTEPPYLWEFFQRQEYFGRLGEGDFFDREAIITRLGTDRALTELETLWPAASYGIMTDTLDVRRYCEGNHIFVDGIRFDGRISELVYSVGDLSGVELYDGRTPIPAEFWTRRKPPCRVMSVWTRRPAVSSEKSGLARGAVWFLGIFGFAVLMLGR